MAIVVSPTNSNSTHHIKLSDGVNQVGLILRSGGAINPRAINRMPRQNGQYSPFTQSDWGSGRGIKDAAADRSRFGDSKRLITRHNNTVMIGGQETFTTGFRQLEQYMPGKVTWTVLGSSDRYIAYKVTASASGNRRAVSLWLRRLGTPTSTVTVELCSDNAGVPGTVLKTVTVNTTTITDTISQLYEFVFSSVQAVTSATVYWVKIYVTAVDTATNNWQVGTDAADTNSLTYSSSNGSSWSNAAYDLYFRLVDDTDQLGALFFFYKSQLYFITRPSGAAAPKLYLNGDRGAATGTHSTTTLQDTTKTAGTAWVVNEWAGAILYIFDGTNSEWSQPYRTIASNTSNTLTFSPAFPKAPVSDDTVYLILGSNKWTEITGHGLTVLPTSVESSGEVCYFAQGDKTKMRKMREFVNNAAWTRQFAEEDNYAKFLLAFRHPQSGLMIGKVNDEDNSGKPSFSMTPKVAWSGRLRWPLLLTACDVTTDWTAGAGSAVSVDNTDFRKGRKSIKIVVSSGPANPTAYFATGVINARAARKIKFWILSTTDKEKGDCKVFLSTSATAASTIQDLDIPSLPANKWEQVILPYIPSKAGLAKVQSIGFRFDTTGTYQIDGLELGGDGEVDLGNDGEKITGLDRYGDPEVPWVFRQQSAGSIENGVFNPIPLRELSTAENIHNGQGHTVHNVNLYFSFLHGIERFYRNNLDDVGPNRDEGLPLDRRGYVTDMKGYIGRFIYNYDVVDGYNSILESTSGTDHHETYRCDTPGKRIRNLIIQVVPGDTADRLWFTEGSDVAWIYLPGNTLKEDTDDTFRFTHEGVLETGWMYGTEQDAVKHFHSVKLFTENLTSNRKIYLDYKTDDNTAWTALTTQFTSSPVQEINVDVSAKRLKLRFRLQTNDNTLTPIIKSMFVSGTTRPETRYTYTLRTTFDDGGIDLEGQENTSTDASDIITQLDAWMEACTVLTLSSVFTPFHNKTVILEPIPLNPYTFISDESVEKFEGTLTLIEP